MIGRVESLDMFMLERQALRSLEHVLSLLIASARGRGRKESGRPARPKRRRPAGIAPRS
jgi:hypothetical protein